MSGRVRILVVDWERLRRAYPDEDDRALVNEAVERARRILAQPIDETFPADLPAPERLARLRRHFAHRAGIVAAHRFTFVTGRERFARAERDEQRTYELHLELNKDLVPPLKEEAKALRAELRRLEGELRARGVDPDSVEPPVDGTKTLAVDSYEPPHFESNESRRERTLGFFRRIGRP
ncbi:MAG: hypothetical protein ABR600_12250 [Actinomycetota bacterium]